MPELIEQLNLHQQKNYLIDMDGVLVHGTMVIPGADAFIQRLLDCEAKFLVLTNNSRFTPRDLAFNLRNIGLPINAENIFTSAMATARFIHSQKPGGTAYVIGESGLTSALHELDYIITDRSPDYVVLGETLAYNFDQITCAIRLIFNGARFIATNPDVNGPTESGVVPACGAMAALIQAATGSSPIFVGKPNPLMMRSALKYLGVHSENTVMIGDRMDTDIIAGVQTGLETCLVLSGVTPLDGVDRFPYVPTYIVRSVADIAP